MNATGTNKCKRKCADDETCQKYRGVYDCVCSLTNEPATAGECTRKTEVPTCSLHILKISVPISPSKIYDVKVNLALNKTSENNTVLQSVTNTTSEYKFFGVTASVNVMVAVAVLVVFILVMLFLVVCKATCAYRNMKKKKQEAASAIHLDKAVIMDCRYTTNPQYTGYVVAIINRDCITEMKEIGEGFFGKVHKGQLHWENEEERVETVAVKMLKQSANYEAEECFMREVNIMSSFSHPNILTLIGICPRINNEAPWMIFEYMPFGDLAGVLRNSSHQFWKSVPALPTLSPEALLTISVQIAKGMEYLAGQRFVHRDLACRNCLVGEGLVVKIADFGMSRDVYTCDYYKTGGATMLPVRWMSPESMLYSKFTLESDIWSYGVVLWEIYSYGKLPYFGYTNEEVLHKITEGVTLDIPPGTPEEIANIMKTCWKQESKDRMKFTEICQRLFKFMEVMKQENETIPRPPPLPVTVFLSESVEDDDNDDLDDLDEDKYLKPIFTSQVEYLETIP